MFVADVSWAGRWFLTRGFSPEEGAHRGWPRGAVRIRKPAPSPIRHSDRGVRCTSISFGKRFEEIDVILPSMGGTGLASDNATAESPISTPPSELIEYQRFPASEAARVAVSECIEGHHSRVRLRSSLGHGSPVELRKIERKKLTRHKASTCAPAEESHKRWRLRSRFLVRSWATPWPFTSPSG
jgi:hypothetical protein